MPTSTLIRPRAHAGPWQQELARAITSIADLAEALDLDPEAIGAGEPAQKSFTLLVPRGFVRRMTRGNPRDPLLLQVLPAAQELIGRKGFIADPLGEVHDMSQRGVLQKYQGRTLLLASSACAVHCRYCFRREFPYATAGMAAGDTARALAAIAADTSVNEVILSGGDPLTLGNRRIGTLLSALDGIDHVRRIRLHTRLPVVLPERVDEGLLAALRTTSTRLVIVLHCNHAQELDDSVAAGVAALAQVPALILNQSVLLRHVNDDSDTLAALSQRLFDLGVLPYYIHQLDPVTGTGHFRVSDHRARQLLGEVAAKLPGYLVPRLAREQRGAPAKEIMAPTLPRRRTTTRKLKQGAR